MKNIIIIIIIFLGSTAIGNAQMLNPATNNIKHYSKIKKLEKNNSKLKEQMGTIASLGDKVFSNLQDTLTKLNNEIKKTDSILAELREDMAFVVFSASSSLNSSEELKNFSGSSRVLAALRLTDRLSTTIAYNLAAVKPQSVSQDSIDLIALMFPESGTTGFTIGANFLLSGNQEKKKEITHSLFAIGEFSFKQTKFNSTTIDSVGNEIINGTKEFSALNYNAGFKYNYRYKPKNDADNFVDFTASIYYNFFNIPNEDAETFEIAIKDSMADRSNISSIGAKFTLQYKGYILFGDFRNNFTPKNFSDDNAFKGFVYNVGTLISTEVFKL